MVQAEFRRRTAVHRMNVRPAEGKPGKRYLPCARPMLVWLCSEWGQQKETCGKAVGSTVFFFVCAVFLRFWYLDNIGLEK